MIGRACVSAAHAPLAITILSFSCAHSRVMEYAATRECVCVCSAHGLYAHQNCVNARAGHLFALLHIASDTHTRDLLSTTCLYNTRAINHTPHTHTRTRTHNQPPYTHSVSLPGYVGVAAAAARFECLRGVCCVDSVCVDSRAVFSLCCGVLHVHTCSAAELLEIIRYVFLVVCVRVLYLF